METKLIKFLNKEHKKRYSSTHISRLDDTQVIFHDMQYNNQQQKEIKPERSNFQSQQYKQVIENPILASMDLSAIENIETNFNEQDTLFGEDFSLPKKKLVSGFGTSQMQGPQFGKSNLQKQPISQSKTIIQKYRHKGSNSLYYI